MDIRNNMVFTCWESSASAASSSCDLSPEEFLLAEAFLFLPDDSTHTNSEGLTLSIAQISLPTSPADLPFFPFFGRALEEEGIIPSALSPSKLAWGGV